MEKIEKNDTDVLGTKEQNGKEKKRNRSKYYAKSTLRTGRSGFKWKTVCPVSWLELSSKRP